MTQRHCIIVDDEPMAIKVLESHFGQLPSWKVDKTFTSASAAADYLQQHTPDLLLLDIQMPGLSGLNLLRTLPIKVPTILTTAHREFALEGYELNVIDYLMKPIGLDRLLIGLAKVRPAQTLSTITSVATQQADVADYIYLKSDRQYHKIKLAEVLYIEALKNHLRIHSHAARYTTMMPIGALAEKLPVQLFLRCHRSFIVAIHQIDRFDHASIFIQQQRIPIGRLYKQKVLETLAKYQV